MLKDDTYFMKQAVKEAEKAMAKGEVPIGAVIVREGIIIARGHNLRESKKNALLHAETVAIDKACKKLGGWRLTDTTLYVTVEPCAMCAGAIINSRIPHVVYGTPDVRFGAAGSHLDLFRDYNLNHHVNCSFGIMQEQCLDLMQTFFKSLRIKKTTKN